MLRWLYTYILVNHIVIISFSSENNEKKVLILAKYMYKHVCQKPKVCEQDLDG